MNLVIYTNILTPYRKYFYDALYKACKEYKDNFYVVVMADTESGRNWRYEELKTSYTILLENKTLSVGGAYIHFNPDLKAVLKRLKPDILICAGGYLCPGIWKAIRWKKRMDYKIYFWSESHLNESRNYGKLKTGLRERIRRKIYPKFDGFWYAGEMSRNFIEKYAGSHSDMRFVPNLIEEEKYYQAAEITAEEKIRLREKYHIAEDRIIFLCPARLIEVKGIDKVIPLIAKCRNHEKVTIVVAGDGELRNTIAEMAGRERLDVRLLGFQGQEEMIELYGFCDFFLLPSISDANPLTCIEALWAGMPLLISEHCGNYPEVIRNGQNGYVFSYKNSKRAIEDMEEMIRSDWKWRQNAKEISLQIAQKQYSTEKVVKDIVEHCHER